MVESLCIEVEPLDTIPTMRRVGVSLSTLLIPMYAVALSYSSTSKVLSQNVHPLKLSVDVSLFMSHKSFL